MAQRKPTAGARGRGTARSTPARPRDEESVARGLTLMRDLLARGVMLTTERLQETLDDAVRRGRMTRDDAEELLASLVAAGRRQTEEVLDDLEAMLGRSRGAAADAGRRMRDRTAQNTERVRREVDRAKRLTGLASFPIGGYDELTAAQITTRLEDLSPAELRRVRDYERRHGNRKTVLSAVERRLA